MSRPVGSARNAAGRKLQGNLEEYPAAIHRDVDPAAILAGRKKKRKRLVWPALSAWRSLSGILSRCHFPPLNSASHSFEPLFGFRATVHLGVYFLVTFSTVPTEISAVFFA